MHSRFRCPAIFHYRVEAVIVLASVAAVIAGRQASASTRLILPAVQPSTPCRTVATDYVSGTTAVWQMVYSPVGLPLERRSAGSQGYFSYDSSSRLLRWDTYRSGSFVGSFEYVYQTLPDGRGETQREDTDGDGSPDKTVTRRFDAHDNLVLTRGDDDGDGSFDWSQRAAYDSYGHVIWSGDDLDNDGVVDLEVTHAWHKLPNGWRESVDRGVDGVIDTVTDWLYDSAWRLVLLGQFPDATGSYDWHLELDYDGAGDVVATREYEGDHLHTDRRMAYDSGRRLVHSRTDTWQGNSEAISYIHTCGDAPVGPWGDTWSDLKSPGAAVITGPLRSYFPAGELKAYRQAAFNPNVLPSPR